jgi:hypothetical protein
MVLDSTDKRLLHYTYSTESGKFNLSNIRLKNNQAFQIIFSYPGYVDHVSYYKQRNINKLDVGTVTLFSKIHMLEEVIVKQGVKAIRIINDTIEYKADSFRVAPNAKVEDLLKRLPGMQIDDRGNIMAYGAQVQRVLIDGEEFFGNDPTLVTRNIRADMVDKVQLYDGKTEQAAFSGMDDGKKVKTVNLKIKEDKKKSIFGKAIAGTGNNGHYDDQIMFNAFNKKSKVSAYGFLSSTGKQVLSSGDERNFGDNTLSMISDNRDLLDIWSGNYENRGQPFIASYGIHYNDKFSGNKDAINSNFKHYEINVIGNDRFQSEYNLPASRLLTNKIINTRNTAIKDRMNAQYDGQIDSLRFYKVSFTGGWFRKGSSATANSVTVNEADRLLNDAATEKNFSLSGNDLFANVQYRQRSKKPGRSISINMELDKYSVNSNGYYFNNINSYDLFGGITKKDTIDQFKQGNIDSRFINTKIIYTEPLSTTASLNLSAGWQYQNSHSIRNTFNKGGDDKYSLIDSLFSNEFTFTSKIARTGFGFRKTLKKFSYSLGTDVALADLDQRNMDNNARANRRFTNWFPQFSTSVTLPSQASLSLNYSGSTIQPQLSQLQPLVNNNDPLNIIIGNEKLRPAFSNNLELTYLKINKLNGRLLWITLTYGNTRNAISSKETIDQTGRRTFNYENVNGVHNKSAYIQYEFAIQPIKINASISGRYSFLKNVNIINDFQNRSKTHTLTFGTYLSKTVSNKIEAGLRYIANRYNYSNTTPGSSPIKYWIHTITPSTTIYLPFKFQFQANGSIMLQQENSLYQAQNVYIINSTISKKFLPNQALALNLLVSDILDNRRSVARSIQYNIITQSEYNLIGRYFMLSLTWDFLKASTK